MKSDHEKCGDCPVGSLGNSTSIVAYRESYREFIVVIDQQGSAQASVNMSPYIGSQLSMVDSRF